MPSRVLRVVQVREATNNDRFMVSSGQLAEIARATND